MKMKKYLIFLNLIVIGCTTVNTNNVKPDVPKSTPTVTPVSQKSIVPTSSQAASKTPEPLITITATPGTGVVSQTPATPTPANINVETSQIKFISGYIRTPNNSFLVVKPFELNMKLSLDKFPDAKKIITFFDLYDADASPKNSHYSLSFDDKNNFILKAKNSKEEVNLNIPFTEIETGKFYDFTFKRDNDKIYLFADNKLLFTRDFIDDDFADINGRRVLNIGADLNGENSVSATFDFVEVKDILYYDFKNNLFDSKKYFLDAIGSGEYKFLTGIPVPMPIPTISSSPTPVPSPTPIAVRDVKDSSNKILSFDLNVYEPNDKTQYDACVERKKRENTSRPSSEILIDCLNGYSQYTSQGFDLGSGQSLKNEPGDMRFITYVDQFGSQLIITGNASDPQVLILDIGPKIFEGVDASYIANKVDYTNENKIYSSGNASSNVIEDHVYAIRTYRYGPNPRYAKVVINKIFTDDYEDLAFEHPKIINQPQFVPTTVSTRFSATSTYDYYLAIFDGTGETVPFHLDTLGPGVNVTQKKVQFSFELPYNSKGYTIYKKDNTQITQIGPILAPAETTIKYEDFGNKGIIVDQVPISDTTTKSAFKPTSTSRPVRVDFSYYFDGNGDLNFN